MEKIAINDRLFTVRLVGLPERMIGENVFFKYGCENEFYI
jgi:hypothetical protein